MNQKIKIIHDTILLSCNTHLKHASKHDLTYGTKYHIFGQRLWKGYMWWGTLVVIATNWNKEKGKLVSLGNDKTMTKSN